jgi:spermidine synthase
MKGREIRHVDGWRLVIGAALAIAACPARPAANSQAVPSRPEEPGPQRLVHREDSPFGTILVLERGDLRYLRFNEEHGAIQSAVSISDPRAVPIDYVRYAAIALAYLPRPRSALMLGLGGGSFSTLLRQTYPDLPIEVVEINPAVVRIAKRYFRVREDPRFRIHLEDGRRFLERTRSRHDLIFLDAYTGEGSIPAHLGTPEFFALVRSRLTAEGVAILNLVADEKRLRPVAAAFAKALGSVACFETADGANLVIVGRATPELLRREALVARAEELSRVLRLPFSLREAADRLSDTCPPRETP